MLSCESFKVEVSDHYTTHKFNCRGTCETESGDFSPFGLGNRGTPSLSPPTVSKLFRCQFLLRDFRASSASLISTTIMFASVRVSFFAASASSRYLSIVRRAKTTFVFGCFMVFYKYTRGLQIMSSTILLPANSAEIGPSGGI